MHHVSAFLAILFVTLGSLKASGQELSEKQKEPWSALQRQVALFMKKDWKKHDEFIHPKAIFAGMDLPAPVTHAISKNYTEALFEDAGDVVTHYMTPVSVTVVDDVAIINCYLQVLTKTIDGESLEATYRLHNTWKKDDGRWRLLATCNAVIKEDEPTKD